MGQTGPVWTYVLHTPGAKMTVVSINSLEAALIHRWTGILAVAAQRAFAATLLQLPVDDAGGVDGDEPVLEEVLGDARLMGLR